MSDSSSAIRQRIKELLIERLNLEGMTPESIGDKTALWGDELGLDSVDALDLMIALEEEYGFRIDSEQVDQKDLVTVASLEQVVRDLQLNEAQAVGGSVE